MRCLAFLLPLPLVAGTTSCCGGDVPAPAPVTARWPRTSRGLRGAFVRRLTAGDTARQQALPAQRSAPPTAAADTGERFSSE